MKVKFTYKKTGDSWSFIQDVAAVPRIGDKVYIYPLRYVESHPRTVADVVWYSGPDPEEPVAEVICP